MLFGILLAAAVPLAAAVEFNRDIRPVLSDKCLACHGADAAAKKIRLRLDSEAAAKADLGGKRAVVEGRPEESELIRRVANANKALRMPPAHTGHSLSDAEIATLRQWIAEGARWEKHWSFLAPERPAPPAVSDAAWVRNPIDSFVLARLDKEGLKPRPEASKETMLRRVTLDLTGLPPSLAEIDAFLADRSPKAYERAVERLLGSQRYGERMAARWLDAARYADTNGYQFDGERVMWRWRDWVIDAFNRNQRFDRFVLEQLAGDMLPGATLDQKIATGFNRNHRANTEDGIIPEEYAVEYVVDRVETVSTVFLGLTLGCARCHNHKYDPFTQKEFYQVFAYFNNVPELGRAMKYGNSPPVVPAPTREQQALAAAVDAKTAAAEEFLAKREKEIRRGQRTWESKLEAGRWTPVEGLHKAFAAGETEARGAFDNDDRFSFSLTASSSRVPDGPLFSRMANGEKGKGYGLYFRQGRLHAHITNSFADDALRLDSEETFGAGERRIVFTYDGSRTAAGLNVYVDGKPVSKKVTQDTLYRPFRNAGAKFDEPFRVGLGGGKDQRFNGTVSGAAVHSRALSLEEAQAMAIAVDAAARKPEAERRPAESNALRRLYLDTAALPAVREGQRKLTALRQERETLERTFPTVMVMAERPVPKPAHVLIRGAYDKPGEAVQPGVPAILPPIPEGAPSNRLGFARWVIDPANPLLARVTVNRFWQMYFGTGLVKTVEDFGAQGEWPSHLELLDWLATEFVRTGWDVKNLQRLIVSSAAYRQSSAAAPELIRRDPENRLLARGPRVRLAPESIRDAALASSGLLHERLGGPSVKPYQPAGLWKELIMQDMDYVQSTGPGLYRRGLYTFWKRTVAPPMMLNFDAANREACVVRESRTNTPLQALNLMNDVTFVEAARFTAERMMKEAGASRDARLRHGFRLIVGRAPGAKEQEVLRDSLAWHLDYFATSGQAERFLAAGDSKRDASLDPRELAAYASVASLILNLDEAVTKE